MKYFSKISYGFLIALVFFCGSQAVQATPTINNASSSSNIYNVSSASTEVYQENGEVVQPSRLKSDEHTEGNWFIDASYSYASSVASLQTSGTSTFVGPPAFTVEHSIDSQPAINDILSVSGSTIASNSANTTNKTTLNINFTPAKISSSQDINSHYLTITHESGQTIIQDSLVDISLSGHVTGILGSSNFQLANAIDISTFGDGTITFEIKGCQTVGSEQKCSDVASSSIILDTTAPKLLNGTGLDHAVSNFACHTGKAECFINGTNLTFDANNFEDLSFPLHITIETTYHTAPTIFYTHLNNLTLYADSTASFNSSNPLLYNNNGTTFPITDFTISGVKDDFSLSITDDLLNSVLTEIPTLPPITPIGAELIIDKTAPSLINSNIEIDCIARVACGSIFPITLNANAGETLYELDDHSRVEDIKYSFIWKGATAADNKYYNGTQWIGMLHEFTETNLTYTDITLTEIADAPLIHNQQYVLEAKATDRVGNNMTAESGAITYFDATAISIVRAETTSNNTIEIDLSQLITLSNASFSLQDGTTMAGTVSATDWTVSTPVSNNNLHTYTLTHNSSSWEADASGILTVITATGTTVIGNVTDGTMPSVIDVTAYKDAEHTQELILYNMNKYYIGLENRYIVLTFSEPLSTHPIFEIDSTLFTATQDTNNINNSIFEYIVNGSAITSGGPYTPVFTATSGEAIDLAGNTTTIYAGPTFHVDIVDSPITLSSRSSHASLPDITDPFLIGEWSHANTWNKVGDSISGVIDIVSGDNGIVSATAILDGIPLVITETSGVFSIEANTTNEITASHIEGENRNIILTTTDQAGNIQQTLISLNVDTTPPVINDLIVYGKDSTNDQVKDRFSRTNESGTYDSFEIIVQEPEDLLSGVSNQSVKVVQTVDYFSGTIVLGDTTPLTTDIVLNVTNVSGNCNLQIDSITDNTTIAITAETGCSAIAPITTTDTFTYTTSGTTTTITTIAAVNLDYHHITTPISLTNGYYTHEVTPTEMVGVTSFEIQYTAIDAALNATANQIIFEYRYMPSFTDPLTINWYDDEIFFAPSSDQTLLYPQDTSNPTLQWDITANIGSTITEYKIYRSMNNGSFEYVYSIVNNNAAQNAYVKTLSNQYFAYLPLNDTIQAQTTLDQLQDGIYTYKISYINDAIESPLSSNAIKIIVDTSKPSTPSFIRNSYQNSNNHTEAHLSPLTGNGNLTTDTKPEISWSAVSDRAANTSQGIASGIKSYHLMEWLFAGQNVAEIKPYITATTDALNNVMFTKTNTPSPVILHTINLNDHGPRLVAGSYTFYEDINETITGTLYPIIFTLYGDSFTSSPTAGSSGSEDIIIAGMNASYTYTATIDVPNQILTLLPVNTVDIVNHDPIDSHPISIAFADTLFTNLSADEIQLPAAPKFNVKYEVSSPASAQWYSQGKSRFIETSTNDGSLQPVNMFLDSSNRIFKNTLATSDYTINNLPTGITITIVVNQATNKQIIITANGNMTNPDAKHLPIEIAFQESAFITNGTWNDGGTSLDSDYVSELIAVPLSLPIEIFASSTHTFTNDIDFQDTIGSNNTTNNSMELFLRNTTSDMIQTDTKSSYQYETDIPTGSRYYFMTAEDFAGNMSDINDAGKVWSDDSNSIQPIYGILKTITGKPTTKAYFYDEYQADKIARFPNSTPETRWELEKDDVLYSDTDIIFEINTPQAEPYISFYYSTTGIDPSEISDLVDYIEPYRSSDKIYLLEEQQSWTIRPQAQGIIEIPYSAGTHVVSAGEQITGTVSGGEKFHVRVQSVAIDTTNSKQILQVISIPYYASSFVIDDETGSATTKIFIADGDVISATPLIVTVSSNVKISNAKYSTLRGTFDINDNQTIVLNQKITVNSNNLYVTKIEDRAGSTKHISVISPSYNNQSLITVASLPSALTQVTNIAIDNGSKTFYMGPRKLSNVLSQTGELDIQYFAVSGNSNSNPEQESTHMLPLNLGSFAYEYEVKNNPLYGLGTIIIPTANLNTSGDTPDDGDEFTFDYYGVDVTGKLNDSGAPALMADGTTALTGSPAATTANNTVFTIQLKDSYADGITMNGLSTNNVDISTISGLWLLSASEFTMDIAQDQPDTFEKGSVHIPYFKRDKINTNKNENNNNGYETINSLTQFDPDDNFFINLSISNPLNNIKKYYIVMDDVVFTSTRHEGILTSSNLNNHLNSLTAEILSSSDSTLAIDFQNDFSTSYSKDTFISSGRNLFYIVVEHDDGSAPDIITTFADQTEPVYVNDTYNTERNQSLALEIDNDKFNASSDFVISKINTKVPTAQNEVNLPTNTREVAIQGIFNASVTLDDTIDAQAEIMIYSSADGGGTVLFNKTSSLLTTDDDGKFTVTFTENDILENNALLVTDKQTAISRVGSIGLRMRDKARNISEIYLVNTNHSNTELVRQNVTANSFKITPVPGEESIDINMSMTSYESTFQSTTIQAESPDSTLLTTLVRTATTDPERILKFKVQENYIGSGSEPTAELIIINVEDIIDDGIDLTTPDTNDDRLTTAADTTGDIPELVRLIQDTLNDDPLLHNIYRVKIDEDITTPATPIYKIEISLAEKVADGVDAYAVSLELLDKYGNIISDGNVKLDHFNNIRKDQLEINANPKFAGGIDITIPNGTGGTTIIPTITIPGTTTPDQVEFTLLDSFIKQAVNTSGSNYLLSIIISELETSSTQKVFCIEVITCIYDSNGGTNTNFALDANTTRSPAEFANALQLKLNEVGDSWYEVASTIIPVPDPQTTPETPPSTTYTITTKHTATNLAVRAVEHTSGERDSGLIKITDQYSSIPNASTATINSVSSTIFNSTTDTYTIDLNSIINDLSDANPGNDTLTSDINNTNFALEFTDFEFDTYDANRSAYTWCINYNSSDCVKRSDLSFESGTLVSDVIKNLNMTFNYYGSRDYLVVYTNINTITVTATNRDNHEMIWDDTSKSYVGYLTSYSPTLDLQDHVALGAAHDFMTYPRVEIPKNYRSLKMITDGGTAVSLAEIPIYNPKYNLQIEAMPAIPLRFTPMLTTVATYDPSNTNTLSNLASTTSANLKKNEEALFAIDVTNTSITKNTTNVAIINEYKFARTSIASQATITIPTPTANYFDFDLPNDEPNSYLASDTAIDFDGAVGGTNFFTTTTLLINKDFKAKINIPGITTIVTIDLSLNSLTGTSLTDVETYLENEIKDTVATSIGTDYFYVKDFLPNLDVYFVTFDSSGGSGTHDKARLVIELGEVDLVNTVFDKISVVGDSIDIINPSAASPTTTKNLSTNDPSSIYYTLDSTQSGALAIGINNTVNYQVTTTPAFNNYESNARRGYFNNIVEYTNDGNDIAYPYSIFDFNVTDAEIEMAQNASSVTGLTGKVLGSFTSGIEFIDTEDDETTSFGDITLREIKEDIRKNASILTRNPDVEVSTMMSTHSDGVVNIASFTTTGLDGVPLFNTKANGELNGSVIYIENRNVIIENTSGDYVLLPTGNNTLIVKGGNVIIKDDLVRPDISSSFGIISITESTTNLEGGNVLIDPAVSIIDSGIYAEGALLSYDATNSTNTHTSSFDDIMNNTPKALRAISPYSDSDSLVQQLRLTGFIVAYNNTVDGTSNNYPYPGNPSKNMMLDLARFRTPKFEPDGTILSANQIREYIYDASTGNLITPTTGTQTIDYAFVIEKDNVFNQNTPPGFSAGTEIDIQSKSGIDQ